jgi:predicted O-linked N-acetylglucosamine transferase (SPINDLY family)
MKWHPQVYPSLLEGNYPAVAQFYEQAIESEPEEVTHYWHLGLAYLLQQQEEEAQTTWLVAMSQGTPEEIEQWTEELVQILDTEAQRQEALSQDELSWLIRGHIREIDPTLINNLLHLIELEIRLNCFAPEHLSDWQVIEFLQHSPLGTVDVELLLQVLAKLLEFPYRQTVAFTEASLPHVGDEPQAFIRTVMTVATQMAYDRQRPTYAADLTQICLKLQPQNLDLLKDLYCFYVITKRYEEALEIGNRFYESCNTISLKVFGSYLLIKLYLVRGAWLEIGAILERYKAQLKAMLEESPNGLNPLLRDSFLLLTQPLIYLEDNPAQNRPWQNQLSQLFQEHLATWLPIAESERSLTSPIINISKRLKIGYIGHTLRTHSVGWLSRWLFYYHDRETYQVTLYLVNQIEDELTEKWFRPNADVVRSFERDPQDIAAQIQRDRIDILIDLDSTTHNITCQVMALKPAPVQVSWLGFDASGLPAIDYYIADPYVLPENAQDYYQEKIWRLPYTYLAVDGFEVGVPTLRRDQLDIPQQAVVYFSVQSGLKRHPATIRLQMKILQAIPKSYLLIKGPGDDEKIQQLFTHIAAEEGVNPDRLRFLAQDADEATHRANLAIADVVLDTYPYNGATTTLEVLWMGIPLVTRVGEQFAARNSYTFMLNAGLTEGIAWTDEEYVEWGIRLGKEEALRQQIHGNLRASRKTSPLWNARQFTQEMEKAYQQMWANYSSSRLDAM